MNLKSELLQYRVEPDVQEPRVVDPQGEDWFPRLSTGTSDLVDAFSRFCSSRTGSFERLVTSWAQGRLRAGLPVNLDEPGSRSIPPRLKKALQGGYERARKSKKRS